ncbi:MAG TPA: TetR/AcrR family transcriptional regulator, partial [Thermoanaerobaculia bacterium]|nr:TetR/AcrR family transcriptional regulator [Thermoanaerobaculia bacterium]
PHRAYQYMRDLVQQCIDEKRFRRMNADTASQALWAAVHGITCLLIVRPTFPWKDREAVIRRVIDSAVDGLAR